MNSRNDRTVTNSEENINSNTKTESSSEEKNMGMESMNEKSKTETNSHQRSYRISKVVTFPPYSVVKISSYANWVNDITVSFKLNIKFTANS